MIDKNDYIWFNQKYLTHKDTEFSDNGGTLEISINGSTLDYQSYSIPILNLCIYNDKIRYNINLKYQDVLDLLYSIEEVIKDINLIYTKGGSEIKKIYNNKNFKLIFKTSKNNGKRAVPIIIANSATDFGVVIVSYDFFLIIVELLKSFKRNYIKLPFEISNRATLNFILDELKEIKEFNKTLPTSILDLTKDSSKLFLSDTSTTSNILNFNKNTDTELPWDNKEQSEFDEFLTNNIDKVNIPELKKIDEITKYETQSFFINDILKNDISNLDSLLMSITTQSNPIEKFRNILNNYMESTLPSITDKELMSACYYSKRFFLYNIQNYTREGIKIPSGIPIIKYNPNEFKEININLAYDLLTISMYIRLLKDRLETKITDASINKSILYMILRNYTDIFTFSFLDGIDSKIIVNCVVNRFKEFSNNGLFKSFNELLKQYNLNDITEQEINNFTNQIIDRVIGGKTLNIIDLHIQEYNDNKIKLPFDNNLYLDQVIEFAKAEIESKFEILSTSNYSKEILEILNPDNSINENSEPWFENI